MAVAKVILNGNTLIDVTDKTVASSNLVSPNTALGADGTTVTGALVTKSASDVTVSGATTTIPAGVYSSQVQKTVSSGSVTTPATSITANPSISVSSSGLITASVSASKSVTPTVSAGYVSSGTAGTVSVSGSNTSQLTTQAAQTITPTTTNQTISSGRYLTGNQTILGDTNLVASNIMSGVSIFGVTGTLEPGGNLRTLTIDENTLQSQSIVFNAQQGTSKNYTINATGQQPSTVFPGPLPWTIGDTYNINGNFTVTQGENSSNIVVNTDFTLPSGPIELDFSYTGSDLIQKISIYKSYSTAVQLSFYRKNTSTDITVVGNFEVIAYAKGYDVVNLNLIDDPRFININRSLYARSFIYDSMPWISEWCDNFSRINTLQFAGQMFIGSFTFNNVAYISEAAFISDSAATLWNVSSGYFNFPSCSLIKQKAFAVNRKNIVGITASNCTMIEQSAFSGCNNLNTISFPNCTSIGDFAFDACYSLTEASFPNCTIIGNYAFDGCTKLSSISFPECTNIGSYAFYNCTKLTSVYFSKCEIIFNNAFNACYSLTSVSFPLCTQIYPSAFYSCRNLNTMSFPECSQIWHSAFRDCSALTSINLPKCEWIGNSAFVNCANISSINFPLCTEICSNAFQSCSNLQTISLPKCKTILDRAFISCIKLQTVSLPKLSSIGAYVFQGCQSLSTAYFMNNSVVTAGADIFYKTPMQYSSYLGYFGSIYVPASLLASYKTATNWATYSSRMVGI